jgi:nucleoid-associated protein YgaU
MSSTAAGQQATEAAAAKAAAEAAAAKPAAKPKPGAPAAVAEAAPAAQPPTELIVPSVINFRIQNGVVQLGLPTTINTMGYVFPVVAQARGGFEKRDDMYVFVPDEVMIGSLPLHRFPYAIEYLMKKAMASEALPPELMTAWKKVKTVVVDDKAVKLTI